MATFADLPVEILLDILQYILPEDLESFAQTCRKVTFVAQAHLKDHRQLVRKYASCSNTPESIGGILNLLDVLLQEEKMAHYVLRLDLRPIPRTVWENKEGFAFSKLSPLPPNLRTLSVEQPESDPRCRHYALTVPHTAKPLLNRLCKVHITYKLHSRDSGLVALREFSTIPSVQVLSAIGAEGVSGWGDTKVLPHQSYVTYLNLCECYVRPGELYQFLNTFLHLQTFTYSSPYDARRLSAFNPYLIRNGLLNSNSTLRQLTLTGIGRAKSFMGSLFEFHLLQAIDTDWGFLGPVWGRDIGISRLPWLPTSLQVVKLCDDRSRDISDYMSLIDKITASKLSDIPHLKKLRVTVPFLSHSENELLFLRRLCDDAGISLCFSESDQTNNSSGF